MGWVDRYRGNALVALVIAALVWIVAAAAGLDAAPVIGLVVGCLGLVALEIRDRRRRPHRRRGSKS